MRSPLGYRLNRGLRRLSGAFLVLLTIASSAGCKSPAGVAPPEETLVFPIAAAMSGYDPMVMGDAPAFLYVANSNFEVAYNSGSLQTYDIDVAVTAMTDMCGTLGSSASPSDEREAADCQIIPTGTPFAPSDPAPIELDDLLVDEVRIGSYADGIALSPDGDRLYLPVRSDADLTHVDVDPATGQLKCGAGYGAPYQSCTDVFRSSDHTLANARDEYMPNDPVAIHVGPLSDLMGPAQTGNYVLMSHRLGHASLLIDADVQGGSQPQLIDTIDSLPQHQVTNHWDADHQILWSTSQVSALLGRVGVTLDGFSASPVEGRLFNAGSLTVVGVDPGNATVDTRDLAFDPRVGRDEVYLLSRRPASIIRGHNNYDDILFDPAGQIDVGDGPSRLQTQTFDIGGVTRLLGFASCFNSRDLYIVDLDSNLLLSVVTGMSGPFEINIDPVRNLVYIVDFRTSVLRFVDLSPMLECLDNPPADDDVRRCQAEVVGMIGQPEAARTAG